MPASEVDLRNYRPFPRSKLQILRVRALRTVAVAPASRRLFALSLIPGSVSRSRHSLARELDSGVAR